MQSRLIVSVALILGLLCVLSGCRTNPANSQSAETMPLGAVNTSQVVDNSTKQADSSSNQTTTPPDPRAYIFTVHSSEAFDIINSVSPKCTACHRISTKGNRNGPGPNLNGLKYRAGSRVPGLSDREYVKQSILNPSAYIVQQCPKSDCVDVMYKKYADKIPPDDVEKLVNYLLSLEEEVLPGQEFDNDGRDNDGRDNDGRDNDGRDNDGRDNDERDNDERDNDGRDNDERDNDGRDNDERDNDERRQ